MGVKLADGKTHMVKLGGQVALLAGAYRTSQVLMLSRIGDQELLAEHGIQMVVDLPQVGKNLHDHLMVFR
jgi:choline dehydrogenase-like flavoprotein